MFVIDFERKFWDGEEDEENPEDDGDYWNSKTLIIISFIILTCCVFKQLIF